MKIFEHVLFRIESLLIRTKLTVGSSRARMAGWPALRKLSGELTFRYNSEELLTNLNHRMESVAFLKVTESIGLLAESSGKPVAFRHFSSRHPEDNQTPRGEGLSLQLYSGNKLIKCKNKRREEALFRLCTLGRLWSSWNVGKEMVLSWALTGKWISYSVSIWGRDRASAGCMQHSHSGA
jgi:hypothetical protein